MSQPDGSRLAMELELLEAMYPGQISYDPKSRDFKFADQSALLHLRLPELYPEMGLPDVISACGGSRTDLRDRTKAAMQALRLADGEEALDAVIACYQGIVDEANSTTDSHSPKGTAKDRNSAVARSEVERESERGKTVVIWLHHLLALSKRKLALAAAPSVSGITKPGYPGIMVFAGNAGAVLDHVRRLKAENWQAFQMRYEADECWEFVHGGGVSEVESMSEVVAALDFGEHGARHKTEFLQAVGIK
ncbi:hypothetical protein K505DRAFT_362140 [Melanomma pulvis-pyrius CBS 109.77]|uniref:RWD domain-containing protein n=1 Tax=Melanomma pulvis-pyrius CBS 109.77 TaxID=1314802 RepID=A0A6A6XAS7_9PLEO|nr:hypothetical protein K505DRAFT_362140 [Melanomma pulvis-pyrius CBS 109.77]